MAKGYTVYETAFAEPITYRSDTCYKTPEGFSDCGETSWRNVLTLFLSVNKGGMVDQVSIEALKQNIVKLNPKLDLAAHQRFQSMMNFFKDYPNITSAATQEAHSIWAMGVSDLNDGQEPQGLNDVQYGQAVGGEGEKIYEIKSAIHEDVKGIINMFNVIAKLIPDRILNKT